MRTLLALAAALAFVHASPDVTRNKYTFINGDFIIGALLPMRHRPLSGQNKASGIKCGTIREDYGIQRAEVALQTIDKINEDLTLLPNVTLGLEIRDDCWYAPIALQQSIEFIRDEINPSPTFDQCTNFSKPKVKSRGPLIGVVGPGSSSVALQVQNLLQLFHFSQIGFSTTSRDLSDKNRFGYFLRVVPSDFYQAQVILDILKHFGWTYVSVVNTDENYGQSGMQAFRELALKADICIAVEDSVLSTAPEEVFDNVVNNLMHDLSASVVVCFCEGLTVQGLLRATRRLNVSNQFLFIGSDGWGDRVEVVQNFEEQAWGGFSIRIRSPRVEDFDDYYFALKPNQNNRNPWFNEFWEQRFNCSLPMMSPYDPTRSNLTLTKRNPVICQPDEEHLYTSFRQDSKLSFVCKAIYTFAHALHQMQLDICGDTAAGACSNLTQNFNRSIFKDYLMNVTFQYNKEIIEFDENGDPPGRYEILNFQKLRNGRFDYVHVGDWSDKSLTWHKSVRLQFGPRDRVRSVCSKECKAGQYKAILKGGKDKRCCWTCLNCEPKQISTGSTEDCETCPEGYVPDHTKERCRKLPIEHVQWTDTQAIVAMAFAIIGIILTTFTFFIFIKHHNTPVVKSSTKELSYIILVGMIVAHSSIFAIITKPTLESCALYRFLPGLSFSMIYAALLTKTNRIARILSGSKKKFPTTKPKFMSATAQVVITLTLIALEVFLSIWIFVVQPPKVKHVYTLQKAMLECDTTAEGILIPLAYDFFLIILCTIYALKTRNVPENFNEAKFIGFCMYTTCVIWIAFIPIYFESEAKIITLCLCITFCALETWAFLFIPKLYIIIFRPERNNRSFFTTSKIRCHIGSRVASAISEKSSITSWKDSNSVEKESCVVEKCPIPQKRTLSCQTGMELLQVLLNPKALMETYSSPTHLYAPKITEVDCCETDTCNLKKITIKLPIR